MRGAGSFPRISAAMRGTSGPEMRTMPTALRPTALAIATMVSALLMRLAQERFLFASTCTT